MYLYFGRTGYQLGLVALVTLSVCLSLTAITRAYELVVSLSSSLAVVTRPLEGEDDKVTSTGDDYWRHLLATATGDSYWRRLLVTATDDSYWRRLLATATGDSYW